jgi:transcriptional regulator with GAF, ATPase, and Fis domain
MPDREEKHIILPSRHADLNEQGLYAALDAIKNLNSTILPLEEVAKQIAVKTRSALKVPCITLWMVNEPQSYILLKAFACADSNESDPKKYNISLEDETSPVAACLKDSKPSIHKKQTLSEMDPRAAILKNIYVSGLIPLLAPAGVMGVFEILTSSNDAINQDELESLEILTTQISLILNNCRNLEQAARQSALQKQLYEITSKINQAKDYESIIKVAVEELCAALNLPGASMHVNLASISLNTAPEKEQHT